MSVVLQDSRADAPVTLTEPPPRLLGVADQISLWANLGITLTLPVAAAFVVLPAGEQQLSLVAALCAVVVGSAIGAAVLGLACVPGAQTGAPAMVLLRGLFGRRGSWLPTGLNLLQCLGWATVEVVVIGNAASGLAGGHVRWLFVVVAGVLATVMALRPLGAVRVLRRYAIWVVLAATAYLFVQVLRHPLPSATHGSWSGFWPATDVVIALSVSWVPLAADYTRHARSASSSFIGAFVGFGSASILYFTLGVLAVLTVVSADGDVLGALLHLPAGAAAIAILALDELDEAFANVYSTAVSAQNIRPTMDRRILAVAVGAIAVVIGLFVSDTGAYENFLYLIGSVFVPLFGVFAVEYYVLRRGAWDIGDDAPSRWLLVVPWAAGFVAYQLVNPGSISWWASFWSGLDVGMPTWIGASLLSLAVSAVLTVLLGLVGPRSLRGREA